MSDSSISLDFSDIVTFNNPADLYGKVIISFDVDWAEDFIIKDLFELLKDYDLKYTIFLTHQSEFLNKIFNEKNISFGLHPNFDNLLNGNFSNGETANEVLEKLIDIYPGCNVIRSHTLTRSSRLSQLFKSKNFSVESNYLMHNLDNIPLPWLDFTGMIQAPISWEDDCWLAQPYSINGIKDIIKQNQLNIINIHPIHVYLNSNNINHYNSCRDKHRDSNELINFRYKGFGVRSILIDLLENLHKL